MSALFDGVFSVSKSLDCGLGGSSMDQVSTGELLIPPCVNTAEIKKDCRCFHTTASPQTLPEPQFLSAV